MQDSLEDRICAAGKHDQFVKAHTKFLKSPKWTVDQQEFYDKLEELGASPEEADEFVNMVMDS